MSLPFWEVALEKFIKKESSSSKGAWLAGLANLSSFAGFLISPVVSGSYLLVWACLFHKLADPHRLHPYLLVA